MTKKCCLIFPHRAFACSVRERRPLARRTTRWRGLPCQRVTRFSDGRQPVEVTSLVFGQEREHLIGTRAMCGSEVASLGRLWRGGCLTVLGDTTNGERTPQDKPGTVTEIPANCAGNSVAVPVCWFLSAFIGVNRRLM